MAELKENPLNVTLGRLTALGLARVVIQLVDSTNQLGITLH